MNKRCVASFLSALLASSITFVLQASPSNAASFEVVVHQNDPTMGIMMTGPIVEGDDTRLAAAMADAIRSHQDHRLRAVGLDSGGGQIDQALKMGARIRSLGLVTVVPESATCASACALLFASGSIKVVSTSARLGVHGAAMPSGEQDTGALAATTYIAKAFAELGAPASVIGRMVVTAPQDMTWLSAQEIGMFPLGFVQYIGRNEFPIILSGYDGMLNTQRLAGQPQTLAPWLRSEARPAYQQAGRALPPNLMPSPYLSDAPSHSQELVNQARDFSRGYLYGVSTTKAMCQGGAAWVRGCNGGASYRSKPYFDGTIKEPSLAAYTRIWLASYDSAYRRKNNSSSCGNGSDPSNDGCRAGSDAWTRAETR